MHLPGSNYAGRLGLVRVTTAMTLFILAATAADLRAQVPSEDWSRQWSNQTQQWGEWQRQQQQASEQAVRQMEALSKGFEETTQKNVQAVSSIVDVVMIVAIIGASVLAIGTVAWVFMRWRASSDPMKLAMSDPWVQAQLKSLDTARLNSAPGEEAWFAKLTQTPARKTS